MGSPPLGRSVTSGSGSTGCGLTGEKRTRWASAAKRNYPSINAKWLPMHTRGPAPKGR